MFDWLTICAVDQTEGCIQPVQAAYLVALVVGAILLFVAGRRARDFTTATLSLMAVAIAINVAVGSITFALRLPIYLDSIGTVLVGVLAGPWAGALTGLLSNLIWSILPIPGGAGPNAAFFAPVAGRHRPHGRLLGQPRRVSAPTGGRPRRRVPRAGDWDRRRAHRDARRPEHDRAELQLRGHRLADALRPHLARPRRVRRGRGVGHRPDGLPPGGPARGRSALPDDRRRRSAAGAFLFAIFRLVFGPTGYFSAMDGLNDDGTADGFPNLTSLALADPLGFLIGIAIAVFIALLVYRWASSRRQRPPVPGLGRRAHDRHRRGGHLRADRGRRLRRRHRRRHGRARRAVPDARAERLPVGVRPGPDERPARQDDQLHHRLRHPRRAADHDADDVQPRRGDRRRMTPIRA